MYNSPNSANNGLFLRLLRLALIHEITNENGEPQSLQLAFSTPRAWLEDGKKIKVQDSPTFFGPVSYTITSNIDHNQIHAEIKLPGLRVPAGKKLTGVKVNGHPYSKFDSATETIDLTGLTGTVNVQANYE